MHSLISRSFLFVPANRPERFEKAFASGAHAVIIDLEDSVPESEKVQARAAAANWLSQGKPTLLRLNSAATEWFSEDVRLCDLPGVAGVVLAKCERLEEIDRVTEQNANHSQIFPMIESAQGFWNALPLARKPFVNRLMFGAIDFQVDLGIAGDGRELDYFRSQLVLISRLAGIGPPVDGVFPAIHDSEKLRGETLSAQRFGFSGKLCIHPRQVPVINECFVPDEKEVVWARRVLEAAAAAGQAAVALDGTMIDRPIIARAQRILGQIEGNVPTSSEG